MVDEQTQYLEIARNSTRSDFIKAHPFYFLYARETLRKPERWGGTVALLTRDLQAMEQPSTASPAPPTILILPVRKRQSTFDSMITIGRTANNDVVLSDAQISRVHAFIRCSSERVEIADAGSRHGTFVGDKRLEGKGSPVCIGSGAQVRFAHLRFYFLDAGAAWDRLHSLSRP